MKKFANLIISIFAICSITNAQQYQQIKNLTTFAKTWGFLKYYHPEATKGNPDWNQELIRMIPLVKAALTDKDFDRLITEWYAKLPNARLSNTITQPVGDSISRTFTIKQIKHFGLPKNLTQKLIELYQYHLADTSIYINDHYKQYHLDYILNTEDPFLKPAFPDEGHRLLGLFRYWNIINYLYPYKNINAQGWDKVLPKFIPEFIAVKNATDYRKTFLMLSAQLKDSHSFFSQNEWDNAHNRMNLPFELSYINGNYYISQSHQDSLMLQQDFRIGDEIVAINNQPVANRINDLKPLTTGTNQLSFYRNIGNNLFKIDTNSNMQLSIKRNGLIINKKVHLFTEGELYEYRKKAHPKLWEDLGNGIYYVRICEFSKPDTLKQLFSQLRQAKTVIWDMRSYPNFKVAQAMATGLFAYVPASTIVYRCLLHFPGVFVKHLSSSYARDTAAKLPLYTGKMIVLVNEQTQSLAESVVYELRLRPNTIIMGRQTAGTTGNITFVDYPGEIEASYTGVGAEGVNGSFTEGKGVKLDEEIKLSPQRLLKYKDYMLEMAYQAALKNPD